MSIEQFALLFMGPVALLAIGLGAAYFTRHTRR